MPSQVLESGQYCSHTDCRAVCLSWGGGVAKRPISRRTADDVCTWPRGDVLGFLTPL